MIRRIGKVKIIDDEYILKEENNLNELYNYLLSRDFTHIPKLLLRDDKYNKYSFIKDFSINNNQKIEDLANIVAILHKKTSYNKEVNISDIDNIYKNLLGYIEHLKEYYYILLEEYESHVYNNSYELLYLVNYSKLNELFIFLESNINKWYNLVKDNNTVRVCLNHGNLKLDHLLNDKDYYLISWNNYFIDSPINDIVKLYKEEWNKCDFNKFFNIYINKVNLSEEEKLLLFISICIPDKLELTDSIYNNTVIVSNFFDYIYKTESLIRPYYSKENKE